MKQRLDVYLTEHRLVESREKAKAIIMSGSVFVDGQINDKPGTMISEDADVELRADPLKYASRGGLKLEKAIELYKIDLLNKVTADIGASTGGFTDCMLQNGAKRVYSVDVGYGQLAWTLRNDPRVVNLERTNARNLSDTEIPEPLDFFSVDVSFISLRLVVPPAIALTKEGGTAVLLIKPQFEAGKGLVGKNGVVRDRKIHIDVIESIVKFLGDLSLQIIGLTFSPVRGPKGNIEFLIYLRKSSDLSIEVNAGEIVDAAYQEFKVN